ncbi:hypothetical protein KC316_g2948 [Hortaea werneckii]|nr:hypothetical protein KC324_g2419 [Hortaea werneckii]KAI7591279.1 hypothetical protein KC316_g2948 [Hortaea werneckii]
MLQNRLQHLGTNLRRPEDVQNTTTARPPPWSSTTTSSTTSGEIKNLIATNALARGIDVKTVTMVINYDISETLSYQFDYETYLLAMWAALVPRSAGCNSQISVSTSELTKLDTMDWIDCNIQRLAAHVSALSKDADLVM